MRSPRRAGHRSAGTTRPGDPGSGPRLRTARGPRRASGRPAGRSRPKRRDRRPAAARRWCAPPPPFAAAGPTAAPGRRPQAPAPPARRARSGPSRPRGRSRTVRRPSPERSLLQLLLGLALPHLGLHLLQLPVDLALRGDGTELAVELGLVGGEVLERPGGRELVDRGRAGLHLLGLVLCPLDGKAGVGHLLADAGRRLADSHLRLGGGVLRLDRLLLRSEGLDLGRERLLARDELLLLGLELLGLLVETLELLLEAGLPLQRLTGEILAPGSNRLPRLRLELDDALL